jgi:glycosyltransferase involved in cell wall biosynthesis
VGGNAWQLAQGERRLGLQSTVAYYANSWLDYPGDINLRLDRLPRPLREVRKWRFFLWAARHFDVFHFNAGGSLMSYSPLGVDSPDLPILRRLGKAVVVTFQGSDARQEGYCARTFAISPWSPGYGDGRAPDFRGDRVRARKARWAARWVHRLFALNPDLLNTLPERSAFLPYCNVDLDRFRPAGPVLQGRTCRVLHAPTNRFLKGTQFVVEAVERLRRRGLPLELTLVEGLPHAEVLARYREADIVVDQLLLGWYGGLAVEGMALGKPVVCYLREEDLRFLPREMAQALPIVRSTPDDLARTLEGLLDDPAHTRRVGEAGRAFVERWHNPFRVAQQLAAVYAEAMDRRATARAA